MGLEWLGVCLQEGLLSVLGERLGTGAGEPLRELILPKKSVVR